MSTAASPATSIAASDALDSTIRTARSYDVVIAVTGHIGAGSGTTAKALENGLKKYGAVKPIKMSALIQERAKAVGLGEVKTQGVQRTEHLQNLGTELRKRYGATHTAGLAVRAIHKSRVAGSDEPIVFIIDSLKNPAEVQFLRQVYGSAFYLVSIVCSVDKRRSRVLTKYKCDESDFKRLAERDDDESAPTGQPGPNPGQQVRKTLHLGDYFINNEPDRTHTELDPLPQLVARFGDVVFHEDVVRPTREERGMFAAWTASLRSACLSRQVGAAIADPTGQIVATGTNDVPRFRGGLYEDESGAHEDHRCFVTNKFCTNDKEKLAILGEVDTALRDSKLLRDDAGTASVLKALGSTRLNDLIEFSRAVHAEMEAIVSLARAGVSGCVGGVLYSTTYPCHNCARHIVAAGISEVVYIEPYTKSLAMKHHSDAIYEGQPSEKDVNKVRFRLFEGVAPRRYASLFEKRRELKASGALAKFNAVHQDPIFTKSHLQFEQAISERIDHQEVVA